MKYYKNLIVCFGKGEKDKTTYPFAVIDKDNLTCYYTNSENEIVWREIKANNFTISGTEISKQEFLENIA